MLQDNSVDIHKCTIITLNTRVPRKLLARCSNLRHLNLGYNQIGQYFVEMLLKDDFFSRLCICGNIFVEFSDRANMYLM